jgi:hypothetical protein
VVVKYNIVIMDVSAAPIKTQNQEKCGFKKHKVQVPLT